MMSKEFKWNILLGVGLIFIAFCVCMTSPLNPFSGSIPGTDSSVFLTIGQGMLHGKLPYADFFDHKGPLIYFINALGLSIGGMLGVWFIELFLMCVSVFFAYKTARFFSSKLASFLGTGFSFALLSYFLVGGNLTEEYVLPFIFISLYIFVRYCFSQIEPDIKQITILGLCFSISLFLRPNMFGVWFGFCIVILIQKLIKKEYKTLITYILFFIIGMSIVFFLIVLFLIKKGIFDDFIYQYIVFNRFFLQDYQQGIKLFESFIKNIYKTRDVVVLPFTFAIIWLIKRQKDKEYVFYIAYCVSLIISVFLIGISKNHQHHYLMPIFPLFVPVLSFCVDKYFFKYCVPMVLLLLFLNQAIIFKQAIISARDLIINNLKSETESIYIEAGNIIDLNTDELDTISVLGNSCQIYLYTKRDSASKYIYQLPLAEYSVEVKNEYLFDLYSKKPKIIVLYVEQYKYERVVNSGIYTSIFAMIEDEYTEISNFVDFDIYKRNDENP